MTEYTITVNDGEEVFVTSSPIEAIELIQDARADGCEVTYTGDPFADFARLALADEE